MYKYKKIKKATTIAINESYEGETIEQKINRIVNNKEPISDGAPIVYTERKDGVKPEYNIRTDIWDTAIDATDKIAQTRLADRKKRQEEKDAKIIDMKKKEEKVKESGDPSQ